MDDSITVAEAAKIMKVSESYIRRLLRTERIEARKFGGVSWMVSRSSVEAYAEAHKKKGEK